MVIVKITLRQFEKIAAATAIASTVRKVKAATTYTGPLDGFEDKVKMEDFDPVRYTLNLHDAAPLELTFKPGTKRQTELWQKKLAPKSPNSWVASPTTDAPERKDARSPRIPHLPAREVRLREPSRHAGSRLSAAPESREGTASPPRSACPATAAASTTSSASTPDGKDRTEKVFYEYDFAIQAVEQGLAAVAIEPMGFGCRRDPKNKAKGLEQKACQPVAGAALLLGQTMIGWRVWDVMRTIDWIETRPELDAKRVGCMGISGGGTCTLFSSAPRSPHQSGDGERLSQHVSATAS